MGRVTHEVVVATSNDNSAPAAQGAQPTMGEVLRSFWLFWGNAAIFFAAGTIGNQPKWTMGTADVVFWGLVVGMILARLLDITRYQGRTSEGDPATLGHFWRHAATLLGVAGAIWAGAQSVQI
jgi:hypothetical protein